jgi:hypothetical protein
MRFRRYLGEQYANKNNCYTASEQHKNGISKKTQTPLPIITIYFLGYPLKYHKVPVIKINRHYYDVVKQQRLSDKKEIFIESLTHDSYVIQISELDKQQSELERLLSIFDQNRHITNNTHILELNENNYPQKYQHLIRRLQRAIAEPTIRKTMDVEDDYQEQIIEEKDQKLKEKDQKLEKKNQLIAEQNRLIEQLKKQ